LHRAKNSAAGIGSVTGVYINVERAKAKGAVIARGNAEGQDLLAAVFACKARVVFLESFFFHIIVLQENIDLDLRKTIFLRKTS